MNRAALGLLVAAIYWGCVLSAAMAAAVIATWFPGAWAFAAVFAIAVPVAALTWHAPYDGTLGDKWARQLHEALKDENE